MKKEMIQRFTNYVKVDTQSDAEKESCPSTEGQLNLARQLVEEMKSIGIQEVTMDENGYVMERSRSTLTKTCRPSASWLISTQPLTSPARM